MASNLCYFLFYLSDTSLITLIECPLLYPFGTDKPCMGQNLHVLGRGRLADAEFLGDERQTDAVFDKIAVDLWRKVRLRILQPFQNLKSTLVGERSDCSSNRHIAILLIPN